MVRIRSMFSAVERGAQGADGGESGIRTRGTSLPTRFPVVPVRPLRHLSVMVLSRRLAWVVNDDGSQDQGVAERVGFEPTVGLPLQRFSRPPPSSAQPSLRVSLRPLIVVGALHGGKLGQSERTPPWVLPLRPGGGWHLISFRMMGDTRVECFHAYGQWKHAPCAAPGPSRG